MKLIYKIWLNEDGDKAFGEGPYKLLKGVQATGSLREAASSLGMAYSKARRVIAKSESNLGFALTRKKIGGVSGGGSEVTDEAVRLMRAYEGLRSEVQQTIGKVYRKHFGDSVEVEFYKMVARRRREKEE
jgi:molybdate transport system regulatory protein